MNSEKAITKMPLESVIDMTAGEVTDSVTIQCRFEQTACITCVDLSLAASSKQ